MLVMVPGSKVNYDKSLNSRKTPQLLNPKVSSFKQSALQPTSVHQVDSGAQDIILL